MTTARAAIARNAPDFKARIGLVLGSGMGGFADRIANRVAIPYADLPGFAQSGVAGHAGRLVLGHVGETPVAILQGRLHYYERGDPAVMKFPVETLAELGCETVVATNAAGSLRPEMGPGALMVISDHLNLVQASPLFGAEGNGRFVDMVDCYDPDLRKALKACAGNLDLALHEGVYAWVAGPQFETPAEIRMLRLLGADAVGMSTVPDEILARHCGMRALAVSAITNLGAGMSSDALSHEHTMAQMQVAAERLSRLLWAWLEGQA